MGPAADEIAKIEHELDILRSRYVIFQRWARIMKWFSITLAVVVTAAIVSYGIVRDPLVAVVMTVVVVVIAGGAYLMPGSAYRWIDLASPSPGWRCGGPKSEAVAVEAMIADREKRLAELKARPA